jgi:hypothetical protein
MTCVLCVVGVSKRSCEKKGHSPVVSSLLSFGSFCAVILSVFSSEIVCEKATIVKRR